MMSDYRFKYEFTYRFGQPQHLWSAVGASGGIHVWIVESKDTRPYGGVEVHYRSPPEYMGNKAPDHDNCFLLKSPCWHDGSSLQATEFWIPKWEASGSHDHMFESLGVEMNRRFSKEL